MQALDPTQALQGPLQGGASLTGPEGPAPGLLYAGFWRRLLAYGIDIAVLSPLMGLQYLVSGQTRMFHAYWLVPGMLFGWFFHVYLVKRYGGTPGKLLLKMRIALVDGSPVTTKAAVLRYSVLFLLSALSSVALVMSTLSMTDELYFSLGYMDRARKMVELAPPWYFMLNVLLQVWVWGEFATMLFNKRRRAVHDYMAGTVVVRSTGASSKWHPA